MNKNPGICSICLENIDFPKQILGNGAKICAACHFIRFVERCITLGKGSFAGKPFALAPWQVQLYRTVFGTLNKDGYRQIRTVYIQIPKKNGKSEISAPIPLYMLTMDGEPGAQTFSAATTREQAALVYQVAEGMVKRSPILSSLLRVQSTNRRIILRNDPESYYQALTADGGRNDGIGPHCSVIDEVHRWKNDASKTLYEVLKRGGIGRRQPLTWIITTAGEIQDSPIAWDLYQYTKDIQAGKFKDPAFHGLIFEAEKNDDPFTVETILKANPSLIPNGGWLPVSDILSLAEEAKNDPKKLADYKRYHLNIWAQQEEAAIDYDKWLSCAGERVDFSQEFVELDAIEKWNLIDRPCYVGVDASMTTDFTALVFFFPPYKDDPKGVILPYFWKPEKRMKLDQKATKQPLNYWAANKHLNVCDGEVIDIIEVKEKIAWASGIFDIKEVASDGYNFKETATSLEREHGITHVQVKPSHQGMDAGTKRLFELYLRGEIEHGNHPVANWMIGCLVTKSKDDLIKPDKPDRARTGKRIDYVSALVCALDRWIAADKTEDPYKERPLLF